MASSVLILWNWVMICLLLCRRVWSIQCHREDKFVKFEGPYSTVAALKVTTTSAMPFCSTECSEITDCKSFAYLTTTETNNCHLSSSPDGVDTPGTQSVVYRKNAIAGCASSPCLNGGVCEDLCEEPYYMCKCPPDRQGQTCEYSIACFNLNWWDSFDHEGSHTCSGTANYMAGFKRSDCNWLKCLEEPVCCPIPIEYSQSEMTCNAGIWHGTFSLEGWNYCDRGYFVRGFWRSGGDEVGIDWLEEGVCCKPKNAPADWGHCYTEDIVLSFDVQWSTVRCQKPLYYIVGIYTACTGLNCMEYLKCCQIKSL